MSDEYNVRGGVGPPLPGVVGPAGVDGRAEWVPIRRDAGLLELLEARLGSEVDPQRIARGVLAPLAQALDGLPLGAIVAHLPLATRIELAAAADAERAGIRAASGAGDHLLEVARLIQQPPWRAKATIRAVFASLRDVLTGEEFEAVAAALPRELAEVLRAAR